MKTRKHFLICLLCLVVMLTGVLFLNACSNKNNVSDPNDTIESCSVTEPDNGSTTQGGENNACEHVWGEWTEITAATCTAAGQQNRICSKCEATESKTVDPLGHFWNEWTVTTPANCQTEGVRTRVCSRDETHTETQTIEKTGHVYDQETVRPLYLKSAATCTSKAVYYKSCACGYYVSGADAATFTAGAEPSHTFGEWTNMGNAHSHSCACGYTESAVHAWDNGEVVRAATHTQSGEKRYVCTDCGAVKSEAVAKLAEHTYGEWIEDGNIHERVCACGAIDIELHDWIAGEITSAPTHMKTGTQIYSCSHCGAMKTIELEKIAEHDYTYACESFSADLHKVTCECGKTQYRAHTWNAGTLTTESTCSAGGVLTYTCTGCGATKTQAVAAAAHTYGAWVATANGYERECSICHVTETAAHRWDNGTVTKLPTCIEEGEMTYVCMGCAYSEDCDATKTEILAKTTVHVYGDWETYDETQHKQICSLCKAETYAEHRWDNGTVTLEPTHLTKGEKTYTCLDCGATKTEELAKTAAHTFGDWECFDEITHMRTCECGDVEYKAHEFADGVVTRKPTHTVAGEMTYTCSLCGATKTEAIAKTTEHTFRQDDYVFDGAYHKHYCECGEVEYQEHIWDDGQITLDATCETAGKMTYGCSICGGTKTEAIPTLPHSYTTVEAYVDKQGDINDTMHIQRCDCGQIIYREHTFGEGVVIKEATCKSEGVIVYTCACGYSKTEAIAVTDKHTYGEWSITESGSLRVCSICNKEEFSEHRWDNGTVTLAPTHMQEGVFTYTCKDCEATYTDVIPKLTEHSYTEEIASEAYLKSAATCTQLAVYYRSCVCGACEKSETAGTFEAGELAVHIYDQALAAEIYLKNEATCTSAALYYKSCACGAFDSSENAKSFTFGDKLAHDYESVTTLPTCTEDGSIVYTCVYCGDSYTETLGSAGHRTLHSEKAATCTEDGYILDECTVCDWEDREILEKGHSFSVQRQEATCDEDGYEIRTCKVCGETEQDVLPKTGAHSYTVAVTVQVQSCTEDGITKYLCEVCGATKLNADGSEYREINAASGHSEDHTTIVEPTCTAAGYTQSVCKCGLILSITEGESATGHNWEISRVTVEATCSKNGEQICVCSKCGETKTETTEKTAHQTTTKEVAATCTANAYTVTSCANCDYKRIAEISDTKTEHKFVQTVVAPTCDQQGYTLNECSICHTKVTSDLKDALGHSFNEPTCTDDATCQNPGCTVVGTKATGHSYECVAKQAATCTEKGSATYQCKDCEASYTVEIVATGHDTVGQQWTTSSATTSSAETGCTTVESKSTTCKTCNQTVTVVTGSYNSCSFSAQITTPATCVKSGLKTYTCSVCGYSYTEKYEDSSAHNWVEAEDQPTDGTVKMVCSNSGCTATKVVADASNGVSAGALDSASELTSGNVSIELSDSLKNQLKDTAGENGTVTVTADTVELESDALSEDSVVFDLQMLGGAVETFKEAITVRIPYTLSENEDPENIAILYLNKNGEVEDTIWAVYVVIDNVGYAEFQTTHFSYYTVTKLSPKERCSIYGHVEKTISQEVNCLIDGYEKTVCTRCGEVLKETVTEATGHKWQTVTVAATCTADGSVTTTCSECQLSYTVVEKALGHAWSEDKSQAATCTEAGYTRYICSREGCGEAHDVVIAKQGHDYSSTVVTAPTCTEGGYTTYSCRNCDSRYVSDLKEATGHAIVENVAAPTCLAEGYTEHICKNCGVHFANTDETAKIAHSWDIETPTCAKGQTCTVCGASGLPATNAHEYGEDGFCKEETCRKECAHEWYDGKTVAPTCTEKGYTEHICNHCGKREAYKEVECSGHAWVDAGYESPTCDHDGYRAKRCKSCNDTDRETLKHENVQHEIVTERIPATCSSEGHILSYCRSCKEVVEDVTLPMVEHTYELRESTAVSCEKDGYELYVCRACGDKIEKTEPAMGHTLTKRVVAATCSKVGYEFYSCTNPNCNYKKEVVLETLAHSFGACVSANAEQHKQVCTVCGETVYADHAWDVSEVTLAPTHMTEGEMKYTCSACGATETETLEKTSAHEFGEWIEIENGFQRECACGEIEIEEHKWDNGVVTVEATHLSEGVMTYTCQKCQKTKTEPIAKLSAHEFGEWVEQNDEQHMRTCVCGEFEIAEHKWDSGIETVKATHIAKGEITYTCTDCGATRIDTVSELPEHEYAEVKRKDASCDEDGYVTYLCVCGSSYTETLPSTGHSYNESGICGNCGSRLPISGDCDHTDLGVCDVQVEFLTDIHSCEGGVRVIYVCFQCGEEVKTELRMAHDYTNKTIALSEYGCPCENAELIVSSCRFCGEQSLTVESDCDFQSMWSSSMDLPSADSLIGASYETQTYRCTEHGWSYQMKYPEKYTTNGCERSREITYTFGVGLDTEFDMTVTDISSAHNGKCDESTEEGTYTDENGAEFTQITQTEAYICSKCGAIIGYEIMISRFDANGNAVWSYMGAKSPLDPFDENCTEFLIEGEAYMTAQYALTENGAWVMVYLDLREIEYNADGTVEEIEYAVEKYDERGNTIYEASEYYVLIDGKETLIEKYESEYTVLKLGNGEEKSFVIFESAIIYSENGEDLKSYQETWSYQVSEEDPCGLIVTHTDSEGNTEVYTKYSHGTVKYQYSFPNGFENCEQGVLVTEVCSQCGKEISSYETWGHSYPVGESEKIDLSTVGCGCEGALAVTTCSRCGIQRVSFDTGCQWSTVSKDSVIDENGNAHTTVTFACVNCGFRYSAEEWYESKNCANTRYVAYRFGIADDGSAQIEITETIFEGKKDHETECEVLRNETYAEVDGNGNELTVQTVERRYACKNCGTVTDHSLQMTKTDANKNVLYSYQASYATSGDEEYIRSESTYEYAVATLADETVVRYQTKYTYAFYAFTGEQLNGRTEVYSYAEGDYCHYTVQTTDLNGDTSESSGVNHAVYSSTYTLADGASNCTEGVIMQRVCKACGEVASTKTIYSHATVAQEYTMDTKCGSVRLSISKCACGEKCYESLYLDGCETQGDYSFETDENGIQYDCWTNRCVKCGFTYTQTSRSEYDENCVSVKYTTYRLGIAEDGSAESEFSFQYNGGVNHSEQTSSSEPVETEEDGLRVLTTQSTVTCSRCGKLIRTETNVTKYDADGNEVYTSYMRYAADTTVEGGLYLAYQTEYRYGYAVGAGGNKLRYNISEYYVYYNADGSVQNFERYDYSYPNEGDYCTVVQTYTNYYGKESTNTLTKHSQYVYRYVLSEGSESCTDGLDRIQCCASCGAETYRWENWRFDHSTEEAAISETLDLSQYGSVCGAYANIYTCPCGARKVLNVSGEECLFDFEAYYEYLDEETGICYYVWSYCCSVTHPELCGFRYLQVQYTTIDENCYGCEHTDYYFGFDFDTKEYEYLWESSYATGSLAHAFTYSWESSENGSVSTESYTCVNCGAVRQKFVRTSYTSEDGVPMFSNDYYYYNTGIEGGNYLTSHEHNEYVQQTWETGVTRHVQSFSRCESYDASGAVTSWWQYTFDYTNSYCTPTRTYTDSNGTEKTDTSTNHWWNYEIQDWVNGHAVTCTQDAVRIMHCYCCDAIENSTYGRRGHSYWYDSMTGIYTCWNCGLENYTGADGEVELEDLTLSYGDGTQYVVGFYNRTFDEYLISLYLIKDGEEFGLEMEATVSETLIYVDLQAVLKAAEAYDIAACEYMLRVNFVPLNVEGEYDFAITLDPHIYVVDEENCVIPDDVCTDPYVTAYKCVCCGDTYCVYETKGHQYGSQTYSFDSCASYTLYIYTCYVCGTQWEGWSSMDGECNFTDSYWTEVDENGISHHYNARNCEICGFAYLREMYSTKPENCKYTQTNVIYWDLQEDGTYAQSVTFHGLQTSHSYSEAMLSEESEVDENGNTVYTRTMETRCTECGKLSHTTVTTEAYDSNDVLLTRETCYKYADGTQSLNRYEYFTGSDGGRYLSSEYYEYTSSDGRSGKSWVLTFTYDFDRLIRTYTRVYSGGYTESGSESFELTGTAQDKEEENGDNTGSGNITGGETEGGDSSIDFGGAEITVLLSSSAVQNQEWLANIDDENVTFLTKAVYERNCCMEEDLNVNLNFATVDTSSYLTTVQMANLAGDGQYDLISYPNSFVTRGITSGLYADLTSEAFPYLDPESSYWNQNYNQTASAYGKQYTILGNGNTSAAALANVVYFNRGLMTDYGFESFYEIVLDGNWTLELMMSYMADFYRDLNENGTEDSADQFAVASLQNGAAFGFLRATGISMTQTSSNGTLTFATSAQLVNAIDKLGNLWETSGAYRVSDESELYSLFADGRTLFMVDLLYRNNDLTAQLQNSDMGYGVLPMPKYSEDQESYLTAVNGTHTVYAVLSSLSAERKEIVSMIMELAAEDGSLLSEALYKTVAGTNATSQNETMYELILKGRTWAFEDVYVGVLGDPVTKLWTSLVSNNNTSQFTSNFVSNQSALNTTLSKLITSLQSMA